MLSIFITQKSKVKVVEGYVYLHGRITQGPHFLKEEALKNLIGFSKIIN